MRREADDTSSVDSANSSYPGGSGGGTAVPSLVLRTATLMAVVSVALSVATPCGSQLTSAEGCSALLDLQKAAPECLAKVAPKDLCGWRPTEKNALRIHCKNGRVVLIHLEHCGLTSLPASISNLTALQNLDLKSNGLTSLPASIGDLTALNRLYLNNNGLTSLPASIGKLAGVTAIPG